MEMYIVSRFFVLALCLLTLAALVPVTAFAQEDPRKAEWQEKKDIFDALPPEEQEAVLEEVKKKAEDFNNLPPEEKKAKIQEAAAKRYENLPEDKKAKVDARREKAQTAKAKYDSLPEEKKAKIKDKREKIKEKRAANGGKGFGKKIQKWKENHP
ncbi:MAG: DUF3106 domain-containing protein [Rhodospirillales bacterium]|nr:DUF3106 domain-containing protein [Rhodospirillales bacterium]